MLVGGMGDMACSDHQSPSKGSFTASATWIMTDASSLRPIANHEGGHNFGLAHARSLDYDTIPLGPPGTDGIHAEYGDPFFHHG